MRTARINKQKMWYSLLGESDPVYVRDENGNIVYESYTDTDGNIIYITDDNGNKITGNGSICLLPSHEQRVFSPGVWRAVDFFCDKSQGGDKEDWAVVSLYRQ